MCSVRVPIVECDRNQKFNKSKLFHSKMKNSQLIKSPQVGFEPTMEDTVEGCVSNTVEAADSILWRLFMVLWRLQVIRWRVLVIATRLLVENTGGVEDHSWGSLYEVDLRSHGRNVVFVLKP